MDLKKIKIPNRISSVFPASSVMKIALGVSFIAHLALILTVQHFVPVFLNTDEIREYRVELMRDPIDDIPIDKSDHGDNGSLNKVLVSKNNAQDTISLDTKDKRYISYFSIIKKKLLANWQYPPEAKERLMEGKSLVLFHLLKDGSLTGTTITRSSGFKILDKEATRAVILSAPFPPFPDSITADKLNINASFEYRLTSSSG